MNITHHLPKIVNKTPEDMEGLLRRLQDNTLNDDDRVLIAGCIDFATWLPQAIREKDISMRSLQRMLFGEGGGKKKKKKKDDQTGTKNLPLTTSANEVATNSGSIQEDSPDVTEAESAVDDPESLEEQMPETKNSQKGHGRISHSAYKAASDVFVPLDDYCGVMLAQKSAAVGLCGKT